ncbi:MAG: Gfo/Idh/MocA family oxidoreductase [Gaiellaceae bacterium MAG52_C11]|nr:Gfo/Idh/MocA family oxidoreductase [Candidatus Gaiellasilicea maunaloa]
MRLGLLSTARINGEVIRAAATTDRVEVVAVASRDGAKAHAYAREHGLERAHVGYEALLADDAIDAVYISLPNGLHHEWSLRALAAGKNVLCEKPYSRHPAEVEGAFDAAAAADLVLMEGLMYRHHPQTRRVQELVAGGAIGALRAVRATFSFALHDLANARALPELDGGALMDVGCYCVSGARLLAGEPQRASAERVLGSTGVDMALYGTLRHAENVVSQLEASFVASRRQRLEAVGSDGTLVVEAPWRADWGGDVVLRRDGSTETVPVEQADAYRLQLENFADAIEGKADPLLGRADALGQARALAALSEAAQQGGVVTLRTGPELAA